MFSRILWRGLLRRFAVVSDGTCGPGSTVVQGDSWPSCICRPTWYFPVIPAEIHTTRKRAFFCSSWTPMVSPMFRATSIDIEANGAVTKVPRHVCRNSGVPTARLTRSRKQPRLNREATGAAGRGMRSALPSYPDSFRPEDRHGLNPRCSIRRECACDRGNR